MAGLPENNCLLVAITTPVTPDFRPDPSRLLARARHLMGEGCDGVTLFGTTGEGAEFAAEDRMAALDFLIAGGIDPARVIVSAGALSIADVVRLSRHAIAAGVHGLLVMPPCVYRGGITEEGTFRYYCAVIDQTARSDMRLYLYHFPDICGVPITPQVARRLDERYEGMIAGIKDSGGDLDFTQDLIRRFSHLSIFTGTEMHLPEVLATGARGTICGLANVMPRLMRVMLDMPSAFARRTVLPLLMSGDTILSRRPFIPSVKAIVAETLGDSGWRRLVPPMFEIGAIERRRMVDDFLAWDHSLPANWSSFARPEMPSAKVIGLRRA